MNNFLEQLEELKIEGEKLFYENKASKIKLSLEEKHEIFLKRLKYYIENKLEIIEEESNYYNFSQKFYDGFNDLLNLFGINNDDDEILFNFIEENQEFLNQIEKAKINNMPLESYINREKISKTISRFYEYYDWDPDECWAGDNPENFNWKLNTEDYLEFKKILLNNFNLYLKKIKMSWRGKEEEWWFDENFPQKILSLDFIKNLPEKYNFNRLHFFDSIISWGSNENGFGGSFYQDRITQDFQEKNEISIETKELLADALLKFFK